MKRIALALVAMVFALSACGESEVQPVDSSNTGPVPTEIAPPFRVAHAYVYYVEYPDGTRCVVGSGRSASAVAVDCDWGN